MSTDGFEVYEAQTRPRRLQADEVSLTKTNLVISEELAAHLPGVTHVILLFHPEQRIIGVRPVRRGEQGYKMSYRSISARSFYQHFEIRERGRFRGAFERGMIVVDLLQGRRR